jgi:hypothetical protein
VPCSSSQFLEQQNYLKIRDSQRKNEGITPLFSTEKGEMAEYPQQVVPQLVIAGVNKVQFVSRFLGMCHLWHPR